MERIILSVGESKPKNKLKLFAQAIMLIEGTDHSHTFVSWKDSLGLRWVAEARGSGVQALSNIEFKQTNEVIRIHQYEVTPEQLNDAITYVWKNLPTKYSPMQIVGLLIMRVHNGIVRWAGGSKRIGNPFRDGEFGQVCCEFSVRAVQFATGRQPKQDIDSMGMREAHQFNLENGTLMPQEVVDRINRRV